MVPDFGNFGSKYIQNETRYVQLKKCFDSYRHCVPV